MAQVLTREFDCLTCHEPIRIAKLDNVPAGQRKKWERYELDIVTPHKCKKKEQQQEQEASSPRPAATAMLDNDTTPQQIAALAEEVSGLRETVNILISQIQSLRAEVKQRK
jgi:CRISPR/Cas system CMR subunit Cmr6 (Cas7 group RAMP superfamily)